MIIDVRKCLAQGKFNSDVAFSYRPDEGLIDIPYVSFKEPIAVKGSYHILEDDSLEFEAEVTYTLQGLCSRCLRETEETVKTSLHVYFVTEDNEEDYLFRGGMADLSEAVNDAVLLSMPRSLLCRQGCEMIAYHS